MENGFWLPLGQGGVEEFKHLRVLFMYEQRMEHEIDRWISAAATVTQSLQRLGLSW